MANKLKTVLFSDGESIEYADFNNMQRYLYSFVCDMILGQKATVETSDINPPISRGYVYSLNGNAGAVYGDAVFNLTIRNTAGLIFTYDGSAIDGYSPQFLPYYLDSNELSDVVIDVGGTEARWDLLQIKISLESRSQESRDFEDGYSHAITNQSFNKQYGTKLEYSIVKGTEGTPPIKPSADSGYIGLAYIYIPPLHTGLLSDRVYDVRVPLNINEQFMFATDGGYSDTVWRKPTAGVEGFDDATGHTLASHSGGGPIWFIFKGFPANKRLLEIEVRGIITTYTAVLYKWYDGFTDPDGGIYYPSTPTLVEELASSATLSGVANYDLRDRGYWCNGLGIARDNNTRAALVITTSDNGMILDSVRFIFSGD